MILKLRDKTTTISVNFPFNITNEAELRNIGQVMKKYNIPIAKVRGLGSMTLAGVKHKDLSAVRKELGLLDVDEKNPKKLLVINYCSGINSCTSGLADCQSFAVNLEKELADINLPRKLKVAVSGCPNCCMQSMLRDVGFIATPQGWTLAIGGMTGGLKPRAADIMAQNLTERQAIASAKKLLQTYVDRAGRKEKVGKTIERIGIQIFQKALL